jgi:hypothetical protein
MMFMRPPQHGHGWVWLPRRHREAAAGARFAQVPPQQSADAPALVILGESMRRFVEETDRGQWTLLPECLDDFIDENNPVRVIDVLKSRFRPNGLPSRVLNSVKMDLYRAAGQNCLRP